MSKLKIGDEVKIKTEEELGKEEYFYSLHGGKIVTIRNIKSGLSMSGDYFITVEKETEGKILHLESRGVEKAHPRIPKELFEI